jgi:hypothetical protein
MKVKKVIGLPFKLRDEWVNYPIKVECQREECDPIAYLHIVLSKFSLYLSEAASYPPDGVFIDFLKHWVDEDTTLCNFIKELPFETDGFRVSWIENGRKVENTAEFILIFPDGVECYVIGSLFFLRNGPKNYFFYAD